MEGFEPGPPSSTQLLALIPLIPTLDTTRSALPFLQVILDFQTLLFLAARSLSPVYFYPMRGCAQGGRPVPSLGAVGGPFRAGPPAALLPASPL